MRDKLLEHSTHILRVYLKNCIPNYMVLFPSQLILKKKQGGFCVFVCVCMCERVCVCLCALLS